MFSIEILSSQCPSIFTILSHQRASFEKKKLFIKVGPEQLEVGVKIHTFEKGFFVFLKNPKVGPEYRASRGRHQGPRAFSSAAAAPP